MPPFRSNALDNGILVEFSDLTNRYFGDYHRVCVEVRLVVPHPEHADPLIKVLTLERMGVPGAEIEAMRDRLVEDYWQHAGHYLAQANYPARLLAADTAPSRRRY